MPKDFSWECFVDNFLQGDYCQFWYGDKILVLQVRKSKSSFYVEHKGLIVREEDYKTSQELLDNVRIDGKSLQEIWDDLTIA